MAPHGARPEDVNVLAMHQSLHAPVNASIGGTPQSPIAADPDALTLACGWVQCGQARSGNLKSPRASGPHLLDADVEQIHHVPDKNAMLRPEPMSSQALLQVSLHNFPWPTVRIRKEFKL